MTQLSRPYQIALVVLGLFAAVWLVALRGHSATTGGGGSSAASSSAPSQSVPAPAAKPAAPSTAYHGSAPGVAGLTRAIEKAHGAVTQSERHAKQLQEKSAQASGEASSGAAASSSKAGAGAAHPVTPTSAATASKSASGATGAGGASRSKDGAEPRMQATVEGALKRGELVTVLFWNPKGIVDRVVHRELQAVGHGSRGKVAVFAAGASQVGSFGSFTKAVQVNETPTIVIVNPHGQATTLTGLTDAFSIEQAIGEAKK